MLDLHVYDLLRRLETCHADGFPWVGAAQFQDIPSDKQAHAVSAGYVKEKGFGNIRQYRLTEIGKNEANFTASELLRRMQSEPDDVEDIEAAEPVKSGRIRSLIRPFEESPAADASEANVGTRHVLSVEKPCTVTGCNQPRYKTHTKCEAHYKEARRFYSESYAQRHRQNHVAIVEPSIADDDTQPDIIPIVDTPPVTPLEQVASAAPTLTRAFARAAVRFILIAKGG